MPLPFLAAIGIATGAAILAPIVGKTIATWTQPQSVQKELAKPKVQQAVSAATQQVSQAQPGITIGPVKLTTYDIPGAQAYFSGEVQKKTEKQLISIGYSPSQAKQIAAGAGATKIGEGIGEAAGILAVSAGSAAAATKIAGKGITVTAAKSGGKIAAKSITGQVVKASAIAGAYEGAASTTVSTVAREDRVPTPAELAIGTGLGAGTAAAGGYLLSKAYMRGKWTGRAADWIGSSLVDPYEKPGDVLGALFAKGPKVTKTTVPTGKGGALAATFAVTPAETPAPTAQETKDTRMSIAGISETPVPTAEQTPAITATETPTPTQATTAIEETQTQIGIPTQTTAEEPIVTQVEQPTEQPTETPVTTPTATATTVTVPASTIQPRMVPGVPLIPGRPPGTGYGAIQKGHLLYINELTRARGFAKRMLRL